MFIYSPNENKRRKVALVLEDKALKCCKISDAKGEFIVPAEHVFSLAEYEARKASIKKDREDKNKQIYIFEHSNLIEACKASKSFNEAVKTAGLKNTIDLRIVFKRLLKLGAVKPF